MIKRLTTLCLTLFILLTSFPVQAAYNGNNITDITYIQQTTNYTQYASNEIQENVNTTKNEIKTANKISFVESESAFFMQTGDDPRSVPLQTTVFALYGWSFVAECEVNWRYNEIDFNIPGRYIINGDIILPDDCIFEGELPILESVVIVYDNGTPFIKITNFSHGLFAGAPIVIPQGATDKYISDLFEEIMEINDGLATCWTEYGDHFEVPFSLDPGKIDSSNVGVYYPITVELPGGVTFDGQESWMTAVHVIPMDKIDLSAVGFWDIGYIVPWLYEAENQLLWISIDSDEWINSPPHYGEFLETHSSEPNGFYIQYSSLKPGHIYRFQVQYNDNQFSNILVLDFTSGEVPKAYNEQGGDRNGGDRDEHEPPNLGQGSISSESGNTSSSSNHTTSELENNQNSTTIDPETASSQSSNEAQGSSSHLYEEIKFAQANETYIDSYDPSVTNDFDTQTNKSINDSSSTTNSSTPIGGAAHESFKQQNNISQQPSSQNSVDVPSGSDNMLYEHTDKTSITVSGARLFVMMEANQKDVSFFKGQMRATLPITGLSKLGLMEDDYFTVTLYQTDENSFTVGFSVNGNNIINEIEEKFTVSIPWNYDSVFCELESNQPINGIIKQDTSSAEFELTLTGTYNLSIDIKDINNTDNTTMATGYPNSNIYNEQENTSTHIKKNKNDIVTPMLSVGAVITGSFAVIFKKRWWK